MSKNIYIASLLVILLTACKGDTIEGELTDIFRVEFEKHLKLESTVPENALYLLGDSLTAGMPAEKYFNNVVNYGIRQDTSHGLNLRTQKYSSIKTARAIVVCIGINDFWRGRKNDAILSNIVKILNNLPSGSKIIVYGLLPVDEKTGWAGWNDRIVELNSNIEKTLSKTRFAYVNLREQMIDDEGNLISKFHNGDGVHLSEEGYLVWMESLKRELTPNADNIE